MLSNDVLILREAIRKLLSKLEENEKNTTDETNAVVEAYDKWIGSINRINAVKRKGPTPLTLPYLPACWLSVAHD